MKKTYVKAKDEKTRLHPEYKLVQPIGISYIKSSTYIYKEVQNKWRDENWK